MSRRLLLTTPKVALHSSAFYGLYYCHSTSSTNGRYWVMQNVSKCNSFRWHPHVCMVESIIVLLLLTNAITIIILLILSVHCQGYAWCLTECMLRLILPLRTWLDAARCMFLLFCHVGGWTSSQYPCPTFWPTEQDWRPQLCIGNLSFSARRQVVGSVNLWCLWTQLLQITAKKSFASLLRRTCSSPVGRCQC